MELYNTLSRKKELFVPLEEGKVKMYNCGPTVYNYIHVGNARPLVAFDTLRRYFIYKGYDVDFVVNFTDIDDKIINKANDEGVTTEEISERYIQAFYEDVEELNIYDYNIINPKATEYVDNIIEFISGLIDKGAAYNVDGNVYFDVDAAKDYGKLSKKNIDDLISGARVDINDEKESPVDFALWKKKKPGEPAWDSPWGEGRPGWHIECSVMAKSLLGDSIDIHSGGEDLQFPHHENEIAQSETLNEKPFAKYWLHNAMITVDNQKMSKSLGNFFTLRDVKAEYNLEILRFFLLSAHYRSPVNFSREVMDQMKSGLERIYTSKYALEDLLETTEDRELDSADEEVIKSLDERKLGFEKAMDDDINTADAISEIFNIVKIANSNIDENSNKKVVEYALNVLNSLNTVLGIGGKSRETITDEDIIALIEERNNARKNKDFARADEIRDELTAKGIVLEDTREGVKFRRV